VVLFLGTNPSAATLSYAPVLSGEGGIAIFPDLKVSVNGEGYTLVATAGQALPAVSSPFNAITPCDRLVVTSTADTAACGTLRAAITEANSHEGLDTITFNIPGAVPHVIAPLTPLPAISEAVVIDGTSDPHYELDLEPAITIDGNAVAGEGLQLMAGASTIKGFNIIRFHGASGYAIHVLAAAGGSVIEKNYIGTDRTHAPGLGNIIGVRLNYPNTVTVRDNTISGNAAEGILLVGGAGNVIRNNFIGTVPGGLSAVPNGSNGITLYDGSQNTVIRDNVISGNGIGLPGEANRWGIEIQQSGGLAFVAGTQFLHNTIGLSSAGAALPNLSGGISANAAGVTIIGTPADGNVIAGNSGIGVLVIAGTATIRGNSIYDNDGIGIDLGADGVTVNDPGDGDAGPNGLQNSPVLSNATTAGVDFALSAPDPNYTYEFFSSPACDPTGFGEGRTLLGSWTAGPTGTAMFSLDAAVGSFITATATDASGNTSEFSNCIPVPGPLTSVITSASPQPVAAGFGQMLTVRGTNLQATAAGDVLFSQGGGEVAASYMWGANSTMAIVRLPETLTPGLPTSVRLKNGPGTAFSNSFPITVSLTPGAPVLAALLGACNTGTETNVTSVSSGQQVYVLADGVDSSGTTFVWTSPLGTVLTTPGSSTTGG
ncbi:MAG: right-handed parallel beta-helix repeat-containing protein, partial [Acidobacteria bacterium]|nr:right-handed parallel beta-helix repeat-containing protein [Acidobacteriota bacterium]